jgi:hypothetical protein
MPRKYFSVDKIEKNEMGRACRNIRERKVASRVLVGKPDVKRLLGRPRRRWEDNIKVDLQEVGCGVMDWIDPAQDRDRQRAFVKAVMNILVP